MRWRTAVVLLAALGSAAAAAFGAGTADAAARRPNVLLITVDDLATDLSIYGNDQVVSPNFERLAQRALRFDRAYAQFPSCNGSRTSMLTGLRPDSTGILDNKVFFRTLLPDIVTLPEFFRHRGYLTVGIGKIFHPSGGESWNDLQSWDILQTPHGAKKGRQGKGRNVTDGQISWARWVAARGKDKHQKDGQVALSAVAALEDLYESKQRFFLAVGFHRPHSPYIVPKRYFELYKLNKLELHDPPSERSEEIPAAVGLFPKMTRRDRREFVRGYYAAISFTDRQLGRILDVLDRFDGWSNTVVVVTSDHGFHLGEHDWWGKNTVFEPSLRVPLLVHAPGIARKRKKSPRRVELLDIYPTLVDLAGMRVPRHLEGKSLVPLLEEPRRDWTPAAFSQVQLGNVKGESLRTGRWRFTEWNGGEEGVELYDHSSDPDEYLNLADQSEYGELIEEFSALLESTFADWRRARVSGLAESVDPHYPSRAIEKQPGDFE